MPLQSDAQIAQLLNTIKTIALVIASPKPQRDSNKILCYLVQRGYEVFPINPGHAGSEIAGRTVYASLRDIPYPIDMVDIFRRSDHVLPIVEEAIEVGAGSIWMQLGVINQAAVSMAKEAGLQVVMDRCPAIDIPHLQAKGMM